MNIGRRVYGLGAIAMGAASLVFHAAAAPSHFALQDALAEASDAILVLGGVGVNLRRTAGAGAGLLAGLFAVWAVALGGPSLLAKPLAMVSWQNVAEMTAMSAGGVVALALAPGGAEADRAASVARAGRLAFGLCLPIFGASHFVYAALTASLVPAWLPPGPRFWTYATGLAQIAAGLALLSGVQARLAAILLTAMYAIFALLVHTPLILAAPRDPGDWSELCETLVLMGAAWTVADSTRRRRRSSPTTG